MWVLGVGLSWGDLRWRSVALLPFFWKPFTGSAAPAKKRQERTARSLVYGKLWGKLRDIKDWTSFPWIHLAFFPYSSPIHTILLTRMADNLLDVVGPPTAKRPKLNSPLSGSDGTGKHGNNNNNGGGHTGVTGLNDLLNFRHAFLSRGSELLNIMMRIKLLLICETNTLHIVSILFLIRKVIMVLGIIPLPRFMSKMCFIITIALQFYVPIRYYFIFQLHMCFYKHTNYVARADSCRQHWRFLTTIKRWICFNERLKFRVRPSPEDGLHISLLNYPLKSFWQRNLKLPSGLLPHPDAKAGVYLFILSKLSATVLYYCSKTRYCHLASRTVVSLVRPEKQLLRTV